MTMNIRTQGFSLTSALKDSVESHLSMALGRYRNRVHRVDVSLSDDGGRSGRSSDKRCLITLQLESKSIVIQQKGADMYDTIHSCVGRIRQALTRHMEKRRQFRRESIRYRHIPIEAAS